VLATSLSAHFVNWVDKTEEIKQVFSHFVALFNNPEETLKNFTAALSLSSPGMRAQAQSGKLMRPDDPIVHHSQDLEDEELGTWRASDSLSRDRGQLSNFITELEHVAAQEAATRLPWSPAFFSSSSRALLREGLGSPGSGFNDLRSRMGGGSGGVPSGGEVRSGPFNLCDFEVTTENIANVSNLQIDRHADWLVGSFLLHYDRLSWGATLPSGKIEATSEDQWGDPMRSEFRKATLAVNKATRAFAHVEHRERRELQRQRLKPTRMAQLDSDADPDSGSASVPANPSSAEEAGAVK